MHKNTTEVSREEWNSLRYPVTLRECSEEDGGGWMAFIPMLGEAGFVADGDTPQEAVESLERIRRYLYDEVIASGLPIPIPLDDIEERSQASGKWLMRTTPYLHLSLKIAAELQGVSFNQYCIECLIRGDAIIRGVQEKTRYQRPEQRPAIVKETRAKTKKKA